MKSMKNMKHFKSVISLLIIFTMLLAGGVSLSFIAGTGAYAASDNISSGAGGSSDLTGTAGGSRSAGTAGNSSLSGNAADSGSTGTAGGSAEPAGNAGGASGDAASADAAEISWRELTADLSENILYEETADGVYNLYTPDSFAYFWNALMGRDAVLSKDSGTSRTPDLAVSISGNLPADVTAEAAYTELGEDEAYAERALYALSITLRDGNGNVYIPAEPVIVTVSGSSIKTAADASEPLLVYAYKENKERSDEYSRKYNKDIYAADVTVYRDGNGSDEDLAYSIYDAYAEYEDGSDAVRFTESGDGLGVGENGTIEFTYSFDQNAGSGNTSNAAASASANAAAGAASGKEDAAAYFVVSAQMSEAEKSKYAGSTAGGDTAGKSSSGKAFHKVLTAGDDEKYEISVSYDNESGLPEDAELRVKELSGLRKWKYRRLTRKALEADKLDYVRLFDISIVGSDGRKYQPDENVDVTISLPDADETSEEYQVVHFDKKNNAEILDTETKDSCVSFETDSFSIYAVAYTVDFHWGDYTYNMEGEDSILLSDLLNSLAEENGNQKQGSSSKTSTAGESTSDKELAALADDMSRIESVKFSNPKLVKVEKQADEDWLLTSLAPFNTEEALTITLADGDEIKVAVTDAQNVCRIGTTEYTSLEEAIKAAPTGESTIEILTDIEISKTIVLYGSNGTATNNRVNAKNKTITLTTADDYSGNESVAVISRASGFTSGSLIEIDESTAALVLTNIVFDGNSIKAATDGGLIDVESGSLTLKTGATLKNGYASGNTHKGGGVYVHGGTLTMEDGAVIENCTAERSSYYAGGGVCIDSGSFYMNGGTIRNCSAPNSAGGAIGINHIGTSESDYPFTMTGGLITGCTSKTGGSAIESHSAKGIKVTGGTITGNYGSESGAITFYSGAEGPVYLSGSPRIYGNTKTKSGVTSASDVCMHNDNVTNIIVDGDLNDDAIIGVDKEGTTDLDTNRQFGQFTTKDSSGNYIIPEGIEAFFADVNSDYSGVGFQYNNNTTTASYQRLVWVHGIYVEAEYYIKGHPETTYTIAGSRSAFNFGVPDDMGKETIVAKDNFVQKYYNHQGYQLLIDTKLTYKTLYVKGHPDWDIIHICSWMKNSAGQVQFQILGTDVGHQVLDDNETIVIQYEIDPNVKITDSDGNILYTDPGNPALYDNLENAFEDVGNLYTSSDADTAYTSKAHEIKMLKSSYTLSSGITTSGSYNVTLTTASDSDSDFPGVEGTTTITNSGITSSSMFTTSLSKLTIDNVTLDGNNKSISANGAIVQVKGSGHKLATTDNATIKNGVSTGNGGAFYAASGTGIYINGGSITANSAANGGAAYLADGASMTMSGGSISGNTSEAKGAVTVGGSSTRLYFSDDVVISGNTMGSGDSAETANVYLDQEDEFNSVVNTTGSGLGDSASIGIYVEGTDENTQPYSTHGITGKPFGTFETGADSNLNCFVNDRNGLKGETGTTANTIYWSAAKVCKLTDSDDKLLYLRSGSSGSYTYSPAVFSKLEDSDGGFSAASQTLYYKNGTEYASTEAIKLKMLVDYELNSAVTWTSSRVITFTTAETEVTATMTANGDKYTFSPTFTSSEGRITDGDDADSSETAIIKRGFNGASMLTFGSETASADVTITNLILDGDKENHSTTGDSLNSYGGLIWANGTLTVTTGSVLRNAKSSFNGGAMEMYKGTLTVNDDAKILDCYAENCGGGIHIGYAGQSKVSATIDGSVTISGCEAVNWGGGIFCNGSELVVKGSAQISDCKADNGHGGGINIGWGSSLSMSGSAEIDNCSAVCGGGVNVESKDLGYNSVTISGDVKISSCSAITSGSTSGQGGGIYVDNEGTLTLSGGTISKNTAEDAGGGIYTAYAASAVMTDGTTISGNRAKYGGGVLIGWTSSFTMNDGTVSGNNASINGGGIMQWSSTAATIAGGKITGNSTEGYGSAVCVVAGDTLYITGGSITGNTVSDSCGAVHAESTASRICFSGSPVIYDNTYTSGSETVQKNLVLTADSNEVINTTSAGLNSDAHIGVYVTGDSSTNPYKDHGTIGLTFGTQANDDNLECFTNDRDETLFGMNAADAGAAASTDSDKLIYWGRGICKIVDDSGEHPFGTLNKALTYARGSAISPAMSSSQNVSIQMLIDYEIPSTDAVVLDDASDNITITTAPVAASFTGEKYLFTPTFTPDDGRLSTDSASTAILKRGYMGSSLFTISKSGALLTTTNIIFDGGASFDSKDEVDSASVTSTGNGGIINLDEHGSTLNIYEDTTMRNTVAKEGGAIYTYSAVTINIKDAEFDHCYANATDKKAGESNGGAVNADNAKAAINISDATRFTSCQAVGYLINGTSFGSGGAIYTLGNITVTGTESKPITFTNCSANMDGGAVCINDDSSDMSLTYCSFNNCEAVETDGGAVFSASKTLIMDHCTFSDCQAGWTGGALFIQNGDSDTVNATLTNNSISDCSAANGGGIYVDNGNVSLTGGTIQNCTAAYSGDDKGAGGGVYLNKSSLLNITGDTISLCNATNGGAICAETSSLLEMKDCTVTSCRGTNGGAVYAHHAVLNLKGTSGTISGCQAEHGGAICASGSSTEINISAGSVTGCSATKDGGAVYVVNKAELNLSGGTLGGTESGAGNTGNRSGGAVYVSNDGSAVNMTGGTISGCQAENGGAIYACDKAALSVTGGTIGGTATGAGNTATTSGGGIYATGCAITIGDSAENADQVVISGNTAAGGSGGGIFHNGSTTYTAAIVNTELSGNSAKYYGGAIYHQNEGTVSAPAVPASATMTLTDVIITGCSAATGAAFKATHGAWVVLTDTSVTGCEVTGSKTEGGAINTGSDATCGKDYLYFEGDTVVYNNGYIDSSNVVTEQKNVVLYKTYDANYNTIIRTTENGLSVDAHIGVYAVGYSVSQISEPFKSHGGLGQDFGTYDNTETDGTVKGTLYLNRFTNDINGYVGVVDEDNNYLIKWGKYVCKVTDGSDVLLYSDSEGKAPAVYDTVKKGFAAASGTLYYKNGNVAANSSTNPSLKLKMLADYTLGSDDEAVTYNAARQVTFTTAEKTIDSSKTAQDGDTYTFVSTFAASDGRRTTDVYDSEGNKVIDKDSDEVAIVKRGYNGVSMITVGNASSTLVTENIIFDGSGVALTENATTYNCSTHGGIIRVPQNTAGTLKLNSGTILRNSIAQQGGAICTGGTLEVNGADFLDCRAINSSGTLGNGGAICLESGATATEDGLVIIGHTSGGLDSGLKNAANGGGIYVSSNATFTFTGGEIRDCYVSANGGAIYTLGTLAMAKSGDESSLTSGTIGYCTAANGGGIYVGGGTLSLTGGIFEDCVASENGGTIYDGSSDSLNITGITIKGHVKMVGSTSNARKGGGIYMADGELHIANSTIKDCTASNQGGAVYQIYDRTESKETPTEYKNLYLTNVAIDGHDSLNSTVKNARQGGAVYICNYINSDNKSTKAGPALTINGGSIINDCTAENGGAVYCDSPAIDSNPQTTVTIRNATINGHDTLSSDVWNATDSSGVNSGGGAIYMMRGRLTIGGSDSEAVTIKNCTAAGYGGAVYNMSGATLAVNMSYATIDGHAGFNSAQANAGGSGGGILMKIGTMKAENCTFQDLLAPAGAAIMARTNDRGIVASTVTISGGTISGNTATDTNGGAVNVRSGAALGVTGAAVAKINLEGDAVIYDNIGSGSLATQQKNLVLELNKAESGSAIDTNNNIINTTSTGLGTSARVGVYVVDDASTYHGKWKCDFGTYVSGSTNNFDKFINDRNGFYGEVSENANKIRWQSYLCKLTDGDGKLLYNRSGNETDGYEYTAAVYNTLTDGFTDTLKTLYYKNGTAYSYDNSAGNGDIRLEMLRDYTQPATDFVTINAKRSVTFTTAKTAADTTMAANGDVYIFNPASGASGDTLTNATITRSADGTSMITAGSEVTDLTLSNLILDGGAVLDGSGTNTGKKSTESGGILNTSAESLTLSAVTMRNSIISDSVIKNGGAVYCDNTGTVVVTDTIFENCGAIFGGGIYFAVSSNVNNRDITFDRCAFTNCAATGYGGAICELAGYTYTVAKNNILSECSFTDCAAGTWGGAFYLRSVNADIKDTTFTRCGGSSASNTSNTACISNCTDGTVNITRCAFDNDGYGNRSGGALYLGTAAANLNIYGSKFANSMSISENGYGGAVYANAVNVNIDSSEVPASHVDSEGSFVKYTTGSAADMAAGEKIYSEFTGCSAAKGAAIYLTNSVTAAAINDVSIKENIATGTNGGAINVAADSSIVKFKGNTVVYDNTNNSKQSNMVLEFDKNTVIQTTTDGLGGNAKIGVYVTDTEVSTDDNADTIYDLHGAAGTPFGTYNTSTDNLDKFINDRNGLTGVSYDADADGKTYIYWEGQPLVVDLYSNKDKSTLINGASFSLLKTVTTTENVDDGNGGTTTQETTKDIVIWTGTTADITEDGKTYSGRIVIPFGIEETEVTDSAESTGAHLVNGNTYKLVQKSTNKTGTTQVRNAAGALETKDAGPYARPAGSWTITVNADGVEVTTNSVDKSDRILDMTVNDGVTHGERTFKYGLKAYDDVTPTVVYNYNDKDTEEASTKKTIPDPDSDLSKRVLFAITETSHEYFLEDITDAPSGVNAPTKTDSDGSTTTLVFKGWATSKEKADAGTVEYLPEEGYFIYTKGTDDQPDSYTFYAVWGEDVSTTPIIVNKLWEENVDGTDSTYGEQYAQFVGENGSGVNITVKGTTASAASGSAGTVNLKESNSVTTKNNTGENAETTDKWAKLAYVNKYHSASGTAYTSYEGSDNPSVEGKKGVWSSTSEYEAENKWVELDTSDSSDYTEAYIKLHENYVSNATQERYSDIKKIYFYYEDENGTVYESTVTFDSVTDINDGSKYYYIRIPLPKGVTVENGVVQDINLLGRASQTYVTLGDKVEKYYYGIKMYKNESLSSSHGDPSFLQDQAEQPEYNSQDHSWVYRKQYDQIQFVTSDGIAESDTNVILYGTSAMRVFVPSRLTVTNQFNICKIHSYDVTDSSGNVVKSFAADSNMAASYASAYATEYSTDENSLTASASIAEHPFPTLNKALTYSEKYMSGTSTIQMLADYTMPSADTLTLNASKSVTLSDNTTGTVTDNIVITTAASSGYEYNYAGDSLSKESGESGIAVIKRGLYYLDKSMFTVNGGSLTLADADTEGDPGLIIDGGADFGDDWSNNGLTATTKGGLVQVTTSGASLNVDTWAILRKSAVDDSAAKGGGAIYLAGGATLNMAGTIDKCYSSKAGGAIYAAKGDPDGSTINISGTVQNCKAVNEGGALKESGNATLSVTGTIYNNEACDGGGIYTNATSFNITDGTVFDSNRAIGGSDSFGTTSEGNGGSIYLASKSICSITGGEVKNSTAEGKGGGIYAAALDSSGGNSTGTEVAPGITMASAVSMTGGTIYNCIAASGGGIYLASTSGTSAGFLLDGGTIKDCRAAFITTDNTGNKKYDFNKTITDGESSTTSYCNGGAVYLDGAYAYLRSGTITGNSDEAYDDVDDMKTVVQSVSSNAYRGGAVYISGGDLIMGKDGGDTIKVERCMAENDGGGIFMAAGTSSSPVEITMRGKVTMEKLIAKQFGGAICAHQYAVIDAKGDAADSLDFHYCTSYNNDNRGGQGGAIYAHNSTVSVENAKFEECHAMLNATNYGTGGGAICTSGEALTLKNDTFVKCTTLSKGGAVFSIAKTLTATGCTFGSATSSDGVVTVDPDDACTSQSEGGALCHYNTMGASNADGTGITTESVTPDKTVINSCQFYGNHTTTKNGSGGAMQSDAKALTVTDSVFNGCYNGGKEGGAIRHYSGEATSISGTSFKDCHSVTFGGAVATDAAIRNASNCTFSKCSFTDCYAVKQGGAIKIEKGLNSGTNEISNCTFSNCHTTDNEGGALWVSGGEISDCTFKDCYAKDKGGAIYNYWSFNLELSGTTIDGHDKLNSSTVNAANGGAIYMNKGTLNIGTGDTIKNCTATAAGAGIYLTVDAKMKISGAPDFGGTDMNNDGSLKGTQGNFIVNASGNGTLSSKTNGFKSYSKARQDIYIAEKNEGAPESIIITGDLTGVDGSIWVWAAESVHYLQSMPFAKFDDSKDNKVSFVESGFDDDSKKYNASHLNVFRNAWDDATTENGTDTYLYGTIEGDTTGYAYWTGIRENRKVILRKVTESSSKFTPTSGRTFTVYKGSSTSAYTPKGSTSALSGLTSRSSGVFWIGNLPYGWYIIKETSPEKYFYLVVTANGTYGGSNTAGGYETRVDAESAAKAKYEAVK